MADDFCLIHGYEGMRWTFGNPIPWCALCDAEEEPVAEAPCYGCGGEGAIGHRITVYETGCGFPHDDTHEETCDLCHGSGSEWMAQQTLDEFDLEERCGR